MTQPFLFVRPFQPADDDRIRSEGREPECTETSAYLVSNIHISTKHSYLYNTITSPDTGNGMLVGLHVR